MKPPTRERALRAVEKALTAIHADPSAPHALNDLAMIAGLSPNRFHALFRDLIGETAGAYVRRARMEYAVKMLRAAPEMSLTEAAHASGHSELSDFSRAFKAAYGAAPNAWDRKKTLKNKKNCQAHAAVSAYQWDGLPQTPAPHGERVFIRIYPPFRLAVLRVLNATDGDSLARAFDDLEAWVKDRSQVKENANYLGLTYSDLFSAGSGTLSFELAYPVDRGATAAGDVVIRELPAFTAAVAHCEGGVADFVSAWDRLQREWLPASPYKPSTLPSIEMYFNDPRPSGMTHWDMDCILPVE